MWSKRALENKTGKESADSRGVCPLTFKDMGSVFSEGNKEVSVFGPEHIQGLGLRLKMGLNWLQREWYTYPKHYSVNVGPFFPLPLRLFYMDCLDSAVNTVTKSSSGHDHGHCSLGAERLEILPTSNSWKSVHWGLFKYEDASSDSSFFSQVAGGWDGIGGKNRHILPFTKDAFLKGVMANKLANNNTVFPVELT